MNIMKDIPYIYVDGWKSKLSFSSAHIIPEYAKCGRLHGHTYVVHTKIYGTPDEKGIIIDFSLVKQLLMDIVNKLDHRILIPEQSSALSVKHEKEHIELSSFGKQYIFPLSDCILLPIESTSAENLSKYILDIMYEKLKQNENIYKIEIGVDEGYGQGARMIKTFDR